MWKIRIVFLVCRLLGFEIPKWSSSYNWQTKNNQINLFLTKKKSLTRSQTLSRISKISYSRDAGQARKGYKHAFSSK